MAVGIGCGKCGQTTSWALINQPALSDKDVDKLKTPDAKHPLWR